jgi:para-nitrobenzyl esterase
VVHENIEAFGGDRNNVMVFGESGGGLKTSALYALILRDLFFIKDWAFSTRSCKKN